MVPFLETVALVLLVELLIDRHHLGVGARFNVVPRSRVVFAVPDDVRATCETRQVPVRANRQNGEGMSMVLQT